MPIFELFDAKFLIDIPNSNPNPDPAYPYLTLNRILTLTDP